MRRRTGACVQGRADQARLGKWAVIGGVAASRRKGFRGSEGSDHLVIHPGAELSGLPSVPVKTALFRRVLFPTFEKQKY